MNVVTATATVTRPADTNAYTANDVVSDAAGLRFAFSNPQGGYGSGGMVESAVIIDSVAAATPLDAELWLFTADNVAIVDNAAFAPTDAELLNLVGIITFATAGFKKSTLNAACVQSNLGIAFSGSTLFGVLVARNAYAPTSAEVFKIVLSIIR